MHRTDARTGAVVPIAAAAALIAAIGISGCDVDEGSDGGGLLAGDDIGHGASPVATPTDYLGDASPCRVDPPSRFPGMSEETTAAFERPIDGGTETILVGAWKQDYESYDRARRVMTNREGGNRACQTAYSRNDPDYLARDNMPFSMNVATSRTDHWKGEGADTGIESISTKLYTWGDGHVITVWITRTDGQAPDSDEAARLLDLQIDELDLDRANYTP